jgi:hypothetical protein
VPLHEIVRDGIGHTLERESSKHPVEQGGAVMAVEGCQNSLGRQIAPQIADQRSLSGQMTNLLDESDGATVRLPVRPAPDGCDAAPANLCS